MIPVQHLQKVVQLLRLFDLEVSFTIGQNYLSKKLGRKGIIAGGEALYSRGSEYASACGSADCDQRDPGLSGGEEDKGRAARRDRGYRHVPILSALPITNR